MLAQGSFATLFRSQPSSRSRIAVAMMKSPKIDPQA
jgi:hypothetical protein